MNLVMEAVVTEEERETRIAGMLRNAGAEPVTILLEFMYHNSFAILKDERGKELKWSKHDGAVRGFRVMHSPPKVEVIQPGEAAEVATFTLSNDSRRAAGCGDLHWTLTRLASKILSVEMGYEVTPHWGGLAKRLKADVAVGRWTSPPVTIPLTSPPRR